MNSSIKELSAVSYVYSQLPSKMARTAILRRELRGQSIMRKIFILGIGATFAALAALPVTANTQERVVTGAVIGAGTGAVIAGPPGAVVGGVIGAVVGGPRITPRQECWRDEFGRRICRSE